MKLVPRVRKLTVFVEKEGGALKRDGLTKICWRACLVGLWEFHYHLKDTERKTCQVRRGISLPFV